MEGIHGSRGVSLTHRPPAPPGPQDAALLARYKGEHRVCVLSRVRVRFRSPFSSQVVLYDRCLVTLTQNTDAASQLENKAARIPLFFCTPTS